MLSSIENEAHEMQGEIRSMGESCGTERSLVFSSNTGNEQLEKANISEEKYAKVQEAVLSYEMHRLKEECPLVMPELHEVSASALA